jgi:CubicO group peptidase (beta-lactamase class C family)
MDICEKLYEYLGKALFNYDLPGLAAYAQRGRSESGELSFTAAVGFMDMAEKIPIESGSVFHLASVCKLFVSICVLQLAEQGLLGLDDRVAEHLPWFSMKDRRYKEITVRHILTHTAGLPDIDEYCWDRPEVDEGALRRYVSSGEIAEASLLWAPGERQFSYSNIGYEILGALIAQVSGQSFEDCMEQRIFQPLGMKDSTFLTFNRTGEGRAMDTGTADRATIQKALCLRTLREAGVCMPHTKDAEKHIIPERYFPYNRAHGPSSTLTSNPADMRKWGTAHLTKKLLKAETYEEAWRPYAQVPNNGEHIGLGWFIRKQKGYTLYGHEGSDDGFRASFWICPELDIQIFVASNISQAPVKKINKNIFEIITE